MSNPANAGDAIRASHFAQTNQGSAKHVTTKDSGEIDASFLKYLTKSVLSGMNIDGTTTPVAVFLDSAGKINKSDASETATAKFHGFIKDEVTGIPSAEYDSETDSGSTTFSHTVQAGDDKLIVVLVGISGTQSINTSQPSSVTWNGLALTEAVDVAGTRSGASIWYRALGDIASNTTANVVCSGVNNSSFGANRFNALDFSGIDQASPVADSDSYSGSDSTPTTTVTAGANGVAVTVNSCRNYSNGLDGAITKTMDVSQVEGGYQTGLSAGSVSYTHAAGAQSGEHVSTCTVAFNSLSGSEPIDIYLGFIIDGFTGLTIGSDYYISNTTGAISTSAGTNSVKIGYAISATELFIDGR